MRGGGGGWFGGGGASEVLMCILYCISRASCFSYSLYRIHFAIIENDDVVVVNFVSKSSYNFTGHKFTFGLHIKYSHMKFDMMYE